MQNCETAIDVTIKKACEDIVSERVALFSESDVSDIEISDEAVKRFVKYLRRVLFRESSAFRMLKNTAIAFLIVVGVVLCSTVLIEPIRAYVWEIVLNYYDDYMEIKFDTDDDLPQSNEKIFIPQLPDGWTIVPVFDNEKAGFYTITTPEKKKIVYSQVPVNYSAGYDNDPESVKEIIIRKKQKAYLITQKSGYMVLTWEDDYVFSLEGNDLSEELLVYVAERIE